jgi:hypothetical protein
MFGKYAICFGGIDNAFVRLKTCPHNGKCELKECINFELCGHKGPFDLMETRNGRCMNCDMTFGSELQLKHTANDWQCPKCKVMTRTLTQHSMIQGMQCVACFRTDVRNNDADTYRWLKQLVAKPS